MLRSLYKIKINKQLYLFKRRRSPLVQRVISNSSSSYNRIEMGATTRKKAIINKY